MLHFGGPGRMMSLYKFKTATTRSNHQHNDQYNFAPLDSGKIKETFSEMRNLPGGIMTLPRLCSRFLPWFIDINLAFFQHRLFTENMIGLLGVKKSNELLLTTTTSEDSLSFWLSSDMLQTCIIYKLVSQHRPVDTNPSLATDVNHGGFTSLCRLLRKLCDDASRMHNRIY